MGRGEVLDVLWGEHMVGSNGSSSALNWMELFRDREELEEEGVLDIQLPLAELILGLWLRDSGNKLCE